MEVGIWIMTVHIDDGYLWIGNGTDYLKVFCEHIFYSNLVKPDVEHHEGGVNLGFDLSAYWIVVKATGIWLNTNTKWENFQTYWKSWQQAGTLQIEVIRDGTNKVKIDGTNTVYPCLVVGGVKDAEKMPGNQEKWRVDSIAFELTGTAS